MADILCPTCGRPNPEDQLSCDFCGSPLGSMDIPFQENSSLRDELFSDNDSKEDPLSTEPLDEASRLDSLFSPEPSTRESMDIDGTSPTEPLGDSSRLDYLFSPADSSEEIDRLGSFQGTEPLGDSSRLDDLFSTEESGEEFDRLESLQNTETLGDSSRLDDLFSTVESGEEFDRQESLQSTEPLGDSSRLDDFFADDNPFLEPEQIDHSSQKEPLPEIFSADKIDQIPRETDQESEASLRDDLFQEEYPPDNLEGDQGFLTSEPKFEPIEEIKGVWSYLTPDPGTDPSLEDDLAQNLQPSGEIKELRDIDIPDPSPLYDPEDGLSLKIESDGILDPGLDFLAENLSSEAANEEDLSLEGEPAEPLGEEEWEFPDPAPTLESSPRSGFDLRKITQPSNAEEDAFPDFDSPEFTEDSSWLDMLQDPDLRTQTAPEIPSASKEKKPQTDWLDKIKRLNKSSELVEEDSSFPDWLAVSEKPLTEPEKPTNVEKPDQDKEPPESNNLPSWLNLDSDDESLNEFLRKKDLSNEEFKPKVPEPPPPAVEQIPADAESPAPDLSDSQQIKFPSWAEDKNTPQEIPKELQFLTGLDPDSSINQSSVPFQVGEEGYFDDLFTEELPSWLTSASSEIDGKTPVEQLPHGELPGWVEAMRPVVESGVNGIADDEDYIENYGPLAGISSVLPAEAETFLDPERAARKPLDLIASKSHLEYVTQLKKLIADENKIRTVEQPAPVQTQRVLRWLIAVIMLITTSGTIIFGGTTQAEPPTQTQIKNSGYGALNELIEELQETEPVLIAYDYQPAAAGELHTAAASVVDHLMERGTYLSFVSTQPTGPALAEQFLMTTQAEHHYLHTQQYINLGYLPGESAGLLSFVIAPKKIIPLAFDGSNAWGAPPLMNVNSINDFKMILVITDDPNTAKIWIEQVGTILDDTPLTMVVSAQVEPLIQPYFRSSPQLLSGYVSGVIDAVNYEQLLGKPNLASKIWLPFNLGIIITVGTIFIGGLANGVLSLFSRHRTKIVGDVK